MNLTFFPPKCSRHSEPFLPDRLCWKNLFPNSRQLFDQSFLSHPAPEQKVQELLLKVQSQIQQLEALIVQKIPLEKVSHSRYFDPDYLQEQILPTQEKVSALSASLHTLTEEYHAHSSPDSKQTLSDLQAEQKPTFRAGRAAKTADSKDQHPFSAGKQPEKPAGSCCFPDFGRSLFPAGTSPAAYRRIFRTAF